MMQILLEKPAHKRVLRQTFSAFIRSNNHHPVKIPAMTPDEYCQQKAAQRGSSFYYSVLFLDAPRRQALAALQALRLELAEVVDATADENAARIKLAWWRHEVGQMFHGNPQHLVTRALAPCLARYHIRHEQVDQMVDGMEMDLLQTRYLDFHALERYCDLVSGAAEHCAAAILGWEQEAAPAWARHLGTAIELTRIIRDTGGDARRGRVYFPGNELQQFNVPVADILNGRYSNNFNQLMQFQHDRAQTCFDRALAALPQASRKAQRAALVKLRLHRTLLDEMRAGGFQVLYQRTSLTPVRKLWLAWKTWVTA